MELSFIVCCILIVKTVNQPCNEFVPLLIRELQCRIQ